MANYYEILGVDKNATQNEIKSAYRKLVKQYHPDLHPNDESAAAKFKEINEANETLSDPEKRRQYDYQLEHPNMGGFSGFEGGGFGGFGDFFSDIFSQFTGGDSSQEINRKGQDIQLTIELSFLDAAKGCKREVKYKRKEACSSCRGIGAKNGTSYTTCTNCKGSGKVRYVSGGGFFQTVSTKTCPSCSGKGKIITEKCNDCSGRGYNMTETKIEINIPAGADTNSYMKKRGFGNASTMGGEAGDLIMVFSVLPHKIFKRKEYNLYIELPISYKVAVLGGKVKIPTLNEVIDLTIPEGTQSGKTFTIKGKGIQSRLGVGNLYVTVVIEIPTRVSGKDKKAIEEFDKNITSKNYDKIRAFKNDMSTLYGEDEYM